MAGQEKAIEKSIVSYLESKGAIVEGMQSGAIMIKKGPRTNRMNLQKAGCPDIFCFYNGKFIGIEVKKDEKEVNKWLRLEERYYQGETLPKSYKRELDQIEYAEKIMKNGGIFIITYELSEIIEYIEGSTKKDSN